MTKYRAPYWQRVAPGLGGPEIKHVQYSSSGSTALAGTIHALSQCAVGDTATTRDGLKLHAKHLTCNIEFNWITGSPALLRVVFFVDTAQQGSDPTIAELLQASEVSATFDSSYRRRFIILGELFVGNEMDNQDKLYHFQRRLDFPIEYKGTTDAEASNGRNGVYCMIMTNVASDTPNYVMYSDISFTDL